MSLVRRTSLSVLPLLLGIVCLVLFDASEQSSLPSVAVVESVPATRLTVLLIDSLDLRDIELPAALPMLHVRLENAGLQGPVRACIDGVTVPCVSAMITGFDHASGFSIVHNFGARGGLTERSVLGALQARGHRVGYFGDAVLVDALEGLTVAHASDHANPLDDEPTLQAATQAMDREHLDVVMIHLSALDETAHKFGAAGREYELALGRLDAQLERTLAALRTDDHVVILGDHGHEKSGRHSADVGTMTYAAYLGPRFKRSLHRGLAITDHARLWARLFGLRWGARSFADDYFEGNLPVHVPAGLAGRPRFRLPLLAALLVASLIALISPRVRNARILALMTAACMLTWSALTVFGAARLADDVGALGAAALVGAVGAAILRHGEADWMRDWAGLLVSGALLVALPTAEPTAGLKAPVLWAIVVLGVFAWRAADRRNAVAASLCVAGLFVLALVRVRDFVPRVLFEDDRGAFLSLLLPAALTVAAIHRVAGRRSALIAAAGQLAAFLIPLHAGRWMMAPCALVLPLSFIALARERWFDAVCFLLPIACLSFFPRDSAQFASVALTWWLWSSMPTLLRSESQLLRSAVFVLLSWLSFWTAMSTRIGGVDYDFYFQWLPPAASATSDATQQALLTATKCVLPAVFGVLLAQRAGSLPAEILRGAEQLTRARIAATVVFVVGASLFGAGSALQLLYDATQEVAFWLLMFAVLGLVSFAIRLRVQT